MFASSSQPPFLYLCESTTQHDLITTLLHSGRKNRSNHRCPSHSHQQDYTTFFYTLLTTKNQLTFKHPNALANVSSTLISSLPSSIVHHPKATLFYTSYIITSVSYSYPWQHLMNSKTA
jgi:hypothetical protein